jgi:hypothetical protein
MPCVLLLIEAGAEWSTNIVFEELISAIENRMVEIIFMKKIIFEKWTERIAELITGFTMDPFTDKSLQNLSEFLDHNPKPRRTIWSFLYSKFCPMSCCCCRCTGRCRPVN